MYVCMEVCIHIGRLPYLVSKVTGRVLHRCVVLQVEGVGGAVEEGDGVDEVTLATLVQWHGLQGLLHLVKIGRRVNIWGGGG